jgi:TP53 regulating kinase and related kinases
MKIISQGAEARIYEDKGAIIKDRVPKGYRIKEIDDRLRVQRTRKEERILSSLPVPGPRVLSSDCRNGRIVMEKLNGEKLSEHLEDGNWRGSLQLIGSYVRRLHDKSIIHGDLTTSNMIGTAGNIFMIDFGLSFNSSKIEDKAVDIHLFHQALKSRHHKIAEEGFKAFLIGYGPDSDILRRLDVVEKRGRNKH